MFNEIANKSLEINYI